MKIYQFIETEVEKIFKRVSKQQSPVKLRRDNIRLALVRAGHGRYKPSSIIRIYNWLLQYGSPVFYADGEYVLLKKRGQIENFLVNDSRPPKRVRKTKTINITVTAEWVES
jgi:hypothetical protein